MKMIPSLKWLSVLKVVRVVACEEFEVVYARLVGAKTRLSRQCAMAGGSYVGFMFA